MGTYAQLPRCFSAVAELVVTLYAFLKWHFKKKRKKRNPKIQLLHETGISYNIVNIK